MSILVRDGLLVTQDESRRVLEGNLYVEGGRIREVAGPERSSDLVVDARGCVVMPGLMNCYTRAADILLGPPGDDAAEVAYERMETLQERVTHRDVQLAAALTSADMLLKGTTSFLDLFLWEEEVARAVTQVGNRGFLAWLAKSSEDLSACERYLSRVASWERVTPLVGSASMAEVDLLEQVAALSNDGGIRWTVPLSERRSDVYRFQKAEDRRPVELLEERGILSPRLIALQCVWLTMNEIRSMARAGARAVHCPASNQMTGAGGPMALPEMLEAGVVVGLGTDSPALCGTMDLFHHMRSCALLHKGQRWDATVVKAQTLLDLCTVNSAEALGLDGGSLEEGKVADLIVLDPKRHVPWPLDPTEILSYLAYLAEGIQVRDVMVEGRLVVENGVLKSLDLHALRGDVEALRKELGHEVSGYR